MTDRSTCLHSLLWMSLYFLFKQSTTFPWWPWSCSSSPQILGIWKQGLMWWTQNATDIGAWKIRVKVKINNAAWTRQCTIVGSLKHNILEGWLKGFPSQNLESYFYHLLWKNRRCWSWICNLFLRILHSFKLTGVWSLTVEFEKFSGLWNCDVNLTSPCISWAVVSLRKVRRCVAREFSPVGKQRLLHRFNFLPIRYGFHKVFVGNQVSFGEPSELTE